MDPAPVASEVCSPGASSLLRLTMVDGLGPTLIARAVRAFGSPERVLHASIRELSHLQGVGDKKARQIRRGLDDSERALRDELDLAHSLGVRVVAQGDPDYPPLLAETPASPPVLYIRGTLDPRRDLFGVGVVGSRRASHYGIEQTDRFSLALAQAGLTIVSGGARGVDTSAHRAALRAHDGRTVAVLGCGLASCYPPENDELFAQIVDAGGAIVSELPLRTGPSPENFPARNRIISGMSLGVLVVEAPLKSGALITARYAAEDQGREVMAIPGRVDWASAEGTNELLKTGCAAMVTSPRDVIDILENAARHAHAGTHAARARGLSTPGDDEGLFTPEASKSREGAAGRATVALSERQRSIYEAIEDARTLDELVETTGLEAGAILADATMLELKGLIARRGDRFERR